VPLTTAALAALALTLADGPEPVTALMPPRGPETVLTDEVGISSIPT
jgi:hypothetical protein